MDFDEAIEKRRIKLEEEVEERREQQVLATARYFANLKDINSKGSSPQVLVALLGPRRVKELVKKEFAKGRSPPTSPRTRNWSWRDDDTDAIGGQEEASTTEDLDRTEVVESWRGGEADEKFPMRKRYRRPWEERPQNFPKRDDKKSLRPQSPSTNRKTVQQTDKWSMLEE